MLVHAKIQKWGNSLALRIGGVIREIPQLKEGSEVDIEVTEEGFTVKKTLRKQIFPLSESQIIESLIHEEEYIDLLAAPTTQELGEL